MRDIEHQIQVAYFVAISYHPEWKWIHAIPNGGARHIAVASKLKAEGVKRGIADVFIPYARSGWRGMYIEFKAPGKTLTKEQWEYRAHVLDEGYFYNTCFDATEAYQVTKTYMDGKL